MKLQYSINLCFLSAVFLTLSFPIFNFWILGWIGLVPIFLVIRNQTPKKAFLFSYLTGILFFSAILYWLCYVTITGFIFLVFYLSLYFGILGVLSNLIFSGKLHVLIKALIIGCLWVALEFIRSNIFTGFGWALLGYSQWLNLPIIQVAEFTGAYGVSFLMAMVNVVIAEGLFYGVMGLGCLREDQPSKLGAVCAFAITLLILGLVISFGFWKLNLPLHGQQIKISVVQGNIPQEEKWVEGFRSQILAKYDHLTKLAAVEGPDLIVWPETSVPGYLEEVPFFVTALSNLAKQIETPLLVGAPRLQRESENPSPPPSPRRGEGDKNQPSPQRRDGVTSSPSPKRGEGVTNQLSLQGTEKVISQPSRQRGEGEVQKHYNSAILFSERGQMVGCYDKLRLVPFGEYLPEWFPASLTFLLPPQASLIADFSAGDEPTIFNLRKERFGVLICFEDIFPDLVRDFVENGAKFMVNITNDAWFGRSSAPYQHAQASVFRAVENRVPVVRCANTGFSCFIDALGRIYAKVADQRGEEIFVAGHRTATVVLPTRPTIESPGRFFPTYYTTHGDIFAKSCLLISGIFSLGLCLSRIISFMRPLTPRGRRRA